MLRVKHRVTLRFKTARSACASFGVGPPLSVPAQEKGGPDWLRDWDFVFHRSLYTIPRVAIEPRGVIFSAPRFLLPASRSLFSLPLLVAVINAGG